MSRFRSFRRARKSFAHSAPVLVLRLSACAALIAAAYSSNAWAGTVAYTSTSDGNLATPGNWQGGALPAATDTASFGPTTPATLILQNTSVTLQGLMYTPGTPATSLTLSTTGAGSTALTLGGIANTSSSQQTISVSGANATLNLSGATASISGNVAVVTNGIFAITNFSAGASAGSASIQSLNGATVTFNGASAESANIVSSGGHVYFIGGSSAGSSSLTIDTSAVLGFQNTSTAASSSITNNGLTTFAGTASAGTATINNSGSFAMSNASTLASATLQNSGTTTFSGTASGGSSIISNAGSLIFTGTATAGQASINNRGSGTVAFDQSADASQAQIINTGSIDLSGMQQTLSVGSLAGSGSVALGANTLTLGALDHDDLISGVISGIGGINKTGSATLILSGASLYSGSTSVLAGTLEIDGSIHSPITVGPAAVLTGSGSTSSAVQIAALGSLRPSGIFHIGGDLTLSSQSALQVAVTPSGSSSEVTVDGHATISGANLNVSESGVATDYVPGRSYTILTAQQGVAGTFSQVASSLPLLAPQVHYAADDVTLTLNQVALGGSGPVTGINNIISSGTDSSSSGSGSSAALVIGLDNLNSTALAQALSTLGASSYGAIRRIELEDADDFPRAIVEHRFSEAAPDADQSPAWIELQAQRGTDGNGGSADWVRSGLIGGVQLERSETSSLSVAAQYLRSTMQLGGGNNGSGQRFDIGLDASTYRGAILLDGTLAYGQNSYDVHRFIAFGDYRQGPSANSGGDVFSVRGEIALPMLWQGFAVTPYAALQGTMANADSFQEGGGAATDLYGDARRENIITNSLGIRAKSSDALVNDLFGQASWYLSASLAWLHQSGCLDGQVEASLQADPTHTPFLSSAPSIGHDRAAGDVAINTRWSSGWHIQLRLAADAGRAIHSTEAYAGAGYDF